ncbi:MAG TPA: DUF4350 domain-containing protein [Terriglobales bacterium]|nr:DUF4350 domain-containing protein [Terriglobales bacterium]
MYFAAHTSVAHHSEEFSSLRTDPEGTSVLFAAYQRMGLKVIRGYNAEALAGRDPKGTVVFVIAPGSWTRESVAQFEDFAKRGGRIVMARPSKGGLAERLGASMPDPKPDATPTLKLNGPWSAVEGRGDSIALARRAIGSGEAVVAADATFLSNETLAENPDPKLLSWLVAGRNTILVDETTHMLGEVRGMPWLVRRYQLGAGVLWILIVAGLWVWMRASRLERAPRVALESEIEIAETFLDGYVRLLSRVRRDERPQEYGGSQ